MDGEKGEKKKKKKKKRDFHVGISCASFGYVPETRSTPFCNHTLHFGGLTMKNTQKNKNNREGGGKRCCGREKRRTISTNTRACGGGDRTHPYAPLLASTFSHRHSAGRYTSSNAN